MIYTTVEGPSSSIPCSSFPIKPHLLCTRHPLESDHCLASPPVQPPGHLIPAVFLPCVLSCTAVIPLRQRAPPWRTSISKQDSPPSCPPRPSCLSCCCNPGNLLLTVCGFSAAKSSDKTGQRKHS